MRVLLHTWQGCLLHMLCWREASVQATHLPECKTQGTHLVAGNNQGRHRAHPCYGVESPLPQESHLLLDVSTRRTRLPLGANQADETVQVDEVRAFLVSSHSPREPALCSYTKRCFATRFHDRRVRSMWARIVTVCRKMSSRQSTFPSSSRRGAKEEEEDDVTAVPAKARLISQLRNQATV